MKLITTLAAAAFIAGSATLAMAQGGGAAGSGGTGASGGIGGVGRQFESVWAWHEVRLKARRKARQLARKICRGIGISFLEQSECEMSQIGF